MSVGATRLPDLEQAAKEMPFDQFGRYHMLREAVDACRGVIGAQRLRILDVGGFYDDHGTPTLPLTRFLPHDDLTVLDVVPCELPGYVQGDGTKLHFADNEFDLVVSADTLEHIPRPQREEFWRELLRVARHGVLLLAPFGTPEVELAEAVLAEFIRAELASEQPQLREHREYRLPVLNEWIDFLKDQQIAARAYPTGYLHAWLGMMVLKHMLMRMDPGVHAQHLVDGYYNQCFFPTERRNPAYRHLIVAEKTQGLVVAVDAAIAHTILPKVEDGSAHWGAALTPTLMAVVQHQLGMLSEQQAREAAAVAQMQVQIAADQTDARNARVEVRLVQEQLTIAQADATHARAELAMAQQQLRLQAEAHETLQNEQREQVRYYRQQISTLERILADQQVANDRLYQVVMQAQGQPQAQPQSVYYQAALHDLTERAAWLERQATAARAELEAVKRGRVLRLLNYISGRIK